MGSRALDLLTKMFPQPSLIMYRCQTSPLPLVKRCHGCGRFVREQVPMQLKRSLAVQATALQQEAHTEHPRDISAAIIKLSQKRRTTDAFHKYLKALAQDQIPSKESLYQLSFALYRQNDLTGLYALHDTLLVRYKKTPMSQRTRRSMVYLYTMLISLISKTRHKTDLDAIARLCHEMVEVNLTDHPSLYNSLIHLFFMRRDLSSCHALFENMKRRDIQPTTYTYSIMLKIYGWQKNLDGMSKLLDHMYSQNVTPDAGVVSVLVFGLCRQRRFDLARSFVNKVFQVSGGDVSLLGVTMRERLLKNIDEAQQNRRKVVCARATWRKNAKNKKRKKA